MPRPTLQALQYLTCSCRAALNIILVLWKQWGVDTTHPCLQCQAVTGAWSDSINLVHSRSPFSIQIRCLNALGCNGCLFIHKYSSIMRTVAVLLLAACAALTSAVFHELKPEDIRQSTIDNFPKLFSLKVHFLHNFA